MIWGYNPAPCVDPRRPKDVDYPSNKILHHSLKHLMKNIRGDRNENVGERERLPEWMEDGLQPRFAAQSVETAGITVGQKECISRCTLDARRECFVFAEPPRGNSAFGAPAIVCAGHKCLLQVVAYKNGKNWVTSPPYTIAAHHCYPCFTVGADQT